MKKTKDRGLLFSPSDLTTYLESPFESWMNRFALEFPGTVKEDADDASAGLIQDKGMEHERRVLKSLAEEFSGVTEVAAEGSFEDRHKATLQAMTSGAPVIYQAALGVGPFMGYADFLVRVPGASKLGNFHYEAWDSKLARSTKPYFVIQLLAYSEMLEELQGKFPESITVVLGTGERDVLRTEDFKAYYRSVKKRFLRFQGEFDPKQNLIPKKNEQLRRWSTHAAELIAKTDDLSQVAGIRGSQARKLKKAKICTLTDLAKTTLNKVPDLEQSSFEKLKRQARLQLESRGSAIPKFELLPHPEGKRQGLRLLPAPSPSDVYFDMEGYPLYDEQGLEYLFGVIYFDGPKKPEPQFKDFWAHDRAQEKKAFEAWIDWVYARYKRDPSMHIFHYAAYEVTAMRRLSTQHATREAEVDDLLRNEVFVDLYKIVGQGIAVGEPSYSIKYIEHLFSEKRQGDVTNAGDSMVEYAKYLSSPDGPDWQRSPILKAIRDYNEVDCVSTLKLTDWLRKLQKESQLEFAQIIPNEAPEEEREAVPAEVLALKLLSELDGVVDLSPDQKAQKLLAELLEYHRREAKQYWWKYFEWLSRTHEELVEESDCIGALQRTKKAPVSVKLSQMAEYRFDPSQDVKYGAESTCQLYVDHENVCGTEIVEIDADEGLLTLKLSNKKLNEIGGFPAIASILPAQPINTGTLVQSIFEIATQYDESRSRDSIPPALADLLYRNTANIDGHVVGAKLAVEQIQKMKSSCICIQGPPGAGKTYTGSHTILSLLQSGKRVGVVSNSHHAIENLMQEVFKAAKKAGTSVKGYKSGGDNEEFLNLTGFEPIKSAQIGALAPAKDGHVLVGGTAWTFAREEAVETLDYLFVDEAGQVSLANLVAVSRAAANIVLMGDQRQLEQPTQGSHPGESGESCLNYLLQGHATIPEELGIFLGTTYRMRPEVCGFISQSFYEGRLHSDASTTENRITLGNECRLISKREGIQFVPVEHEDCSQSSEEEAETIKGIVEELLKSEITEKGSSRPITLADILVVAPYNLQVKLLRQRLPEGIAVGSVDKFQGKEAAVVILSMCSSSLEESSRGIEFLFNPNRLNVAISRAKCLAIVVGNPKLALSDAGSIEKMKMLNLFCRVAEEESPA